MSDLKVVDATQLDADLTIVADAIRSKGGTSEKLPFPQGMASAIEAISSGGSGDNLAYATVVQFNDLNLFENDSVVLHLDNIKSLDNVLNQTVANTTVKILEIYCNNKITNMNAMCPAYLPNAENALKKIILYVDTSQCINFNGIVWKQVNLEEITGTPLDFTSATSCSLIFNNCDNLKEVRFKPNTISCNAPFNGSANFTNETIESIINGLVDLSGLTSKTLTLHTNVKAKLTETQLAIITGKNWTLA